MALIVQKFGGSSVKDCAHLYNVARIVAKTRQAGNKVVVVVSAQGDTTDVLMEKASEIAEKPPAREMDVLLSTGEQVSIALLTMALNELGCKAISLTGWQAGFRTDAAYTQAKICAFERARIVQELEWNKVVVVAGFQGLTQQGDITTLGRGGSDTSAVAIAAALHADKCQIYTDVEGVYTADPRLVATAQKFSEITFDEMLALAELGSQVLNKRSVALAKSYNVELEVLSSLKAAPGTLVHEKILNPHNTRCMGIAKDTDIAVIAMPCKTEKSDETRSVLTHLLQEQVAVDIFEGKGTNTKVCQQYFSVNEAEISKAMYLLEQTGICNAKDIHIDKDCAKVSVVGVPLQNGEKIAAEIQAGLDKQNISVKMMRTERARVSVIVACSDANAAVRVMHTMLIDG